MPLIQINQAILSTIGIAAWLFQLLLFTTAALVEERWFTHGNAASAVLFQSLLNHFSPDYGCVGTAGTASGGGGGVGEAAS